MKLTNALIIAMLLITIILSSCQNKEDSMANQPRETGLLTEIAPPQPEKIVTVNWAVNGPKSGIIVIDTIKPSGLKNEIIVTDTIMFSTFPGLKNEIIVTDTIMFSTSSPSIKSSLKNRVIITDTIMFSTIELDEPFFDEALIDLGLRDSQYLERQQTERTVRVERGHAEDISSQGVLGTPAHPPFTPASTYRVVMKSNNHLCIQSVVGDEDIICFPNLDRRLLIFNQGDSITVYDLKLTLSR